MPLWAQQAVARPRKYNNNILYSFPVFLQGKRGGERGRKEGEEGEEGEVGGAGLQRGGD